MNTLKAAKMTRSHGFVTIAELLAQFLLGMVVNLFVELPKSHPGADAREYFGGVARGLWWAIASGPVWLKLHVLLGMLILVTGIMTLVFASKRGGAAVIVAAALGLSGAIGSVFNGASFINYGHEYSSLLMSVGFLIAVPSYGYLVYRLREERA